MRGVHIRKAYKIEVVLPDVPKSEELTTGVLNEVNLEEKLHDALKHAGFPYVLQEVSPERSLKSFVQAVGEEQVIKDLFICMGLRHELLATNDPKADSLGNLLLMIQPEALA